MDLVRTDPEGDRRRALQFAARAARRHDASSSKRAAAVRLAAEVGASLREIADATGLSHMSVKRIVDRERSATVDGPG